jgi:integrase
MTTKTRKAQALTAKAIDAMKPDASGVAYRVPDLRCKGLALRVAASSKTWDLAFRVKGASVKHLSLGGYKDVSLERARNRANELTSAARLGRDLIAEQNAARNEYDQSYTIERLIGEYVRRRITGRLRSAGDVELRLKRALAPLMTRKARDIRRRDLRQLLDAVSDKGLNREAEHRRQVIGAMFKWAVSQDIIESNPADGLSSYSHGQPRDRVLAEDEIRLIWQWLDDSLNISTGVADILKLQLCLGARCSEVSGMMASEFATDNKGRLLWTLPPERSKNKRARVTPIRGLALDIITTRLEAREEILFTTETGKPHYSGTVDQQLRRRWAQLPIAKFKTHADCAKSRPERIPSWRWPR